MPVNHSSTLPDDDPTIDGQDHQMARLVEIEPKALGLDRLVEDIVGNAIEQGDVI
jgi:hypothetical protein